MTEWIDTTLGEVIELKRGYDLPQRDRVNGDFPIFSSAGPTGWHDKAMAKAPGVVTGRYGTLGEIYYVDRDYWPLNTTLYVRDFKGNDPKFIAYYLRTIDFLAFSDKAAVPGLNRNDLHTAAVRIPKTRDAQESIASVLSALDEKIALLQELNAGLESACRLFFKDWFIDFGPTRAKMAGQAPYLAPAVWSLFPDSLDDTGIPLGWNLTPFENLLDSSLGGDWGDEEAGGENSEATYVIRGTDLRDISRGGIGKVPLRYTSQKKLGSRKLQDMDIVIEVSGGSPTQPTGRSLLITSSILERFYSPAVCASFCRRFRPSSKSNAIYAALHLSVLYESGGTWEYQNQSTGISNFQTTNFLKSELAVQPGIPVLDAFTGIVEPLIRRSSNNEVAFLARLRDELLPKLMSGELQVKDAETIVRKTV